MKTTGDKTLNVQTKDTQTTFVSKTSTNANKLESLKIVNARAEEEFTNVNYTRGTNVSENIDLGSSFLETSIFTTGLEISQIPEDSRNSSIEPSNTDVAISVSEKHHTRAAFTGVSLDMVSYINQFLV